MCWGARCMYHSHFHSTHAGAQTDGVRPGRVSLPSLPWVKPVLHCQQAGRVPQRVHVWRGIQEPWQWQGNGKNFRKWNKSVNHILRARFVWRLATRKTKTKGGHSAPGGSWSTRAACCASTQGRGTLDRMSLWPSVRRPSPARSGSLTSMTLARRIGDHQNPRICRPSQPMAIYEGV